MKKIILPMIAVLLLGCGHSKSPKQTNEITQIRYLGQKRSTKGVMLEGYMFLHPKKKFAKPTDKGKPAKPPKESDGYAFIAGSPVKWKTAEPYLIDPSNRNGLDENFVINKVHEAIFAWDNQVGNTIFGPEILGVVDRASIGNVANGQNELIFDDIDEPNVIGITIVWGIFSGPPKNRELREWDMILDDVDFQWGDAGPTSETNLGNTSVMDLLNILTHELGHAAGLGHPADTYTEETMFRFAEEGETKKRTLHSGDIVGIKKLYN
jgi:hypothetical protein